MSKSSHRFSLIYQAVVATSLGVSALSAQAVSLSQANIQSAQHEPLSATIEVSGIDAKNFDASLAGSNVYQQMGLKQDADIQVKFTPTSENTGKITLTSKAPISKPFTDVVLNLKNNDEEVVEPQTLLMPISNKDKAEIPETLSEPIMVASEQEQTLPVAGGDVDTTDAESNITQNNEQTQPSTQNEEIVAMDLSAGDPIELSPLEEATLNAQNQAVEPPNNEQTNTPAINYFNENENYTPTTTETINNPDNHQAVSTPKIISQQEQVLAAITPEGSNQQINILTEQITRRVLDSQEAIDAAAEPKTEQSVATVTESKKPNQDKNKDKKTKKPIETQSNDKPTYVVQSGDSLWGIANQIAQANNMSVMEVMNSIHQQNPDAFFGGNINRLKTNASLNLPSYSVVPSQKAIQEAIHAHRQTRGNTESKASKATGKTNNKAQSKKQEIKRKHNQNQVAQQKPKTTKAPIKPLPKAQMTLVSPNNTGQATGTQEKGSNTAARAGGGNGNNQLVNTLKNTRSQAAANASKVNSLNKELTSAAQKLQLQNQKLAELEARLKALSEK